MGLFTPQTVRGACVPQYVRNEAQARFQLNAIPLRTVAENAWELYFPRPFQILGLCTSPLPDLPPGIMPSWPMALIDQDSPAIQDIYCDMSALLMLELSIANMRPHDKTGVIKYPVEYLRPGIQAVDFRGYFTKYLNDEITNTRNQWFNSFMQPGSMWRWFAHRHTGDTDAVWLSAFRDLLTFIQKTSDQRLYGAPGVYIIQDAFSEYLWTAENEYFSSIDA